MNNLQQKTTNRWKLFSVIVSVIALLSIAAFLLVFFHADYHTKVLVKLGLKEKTAATNYAVLAWNNCLQKLDYDADVVFFGDSITADSDFSTAFPNQNIINLGYGGDTLTGMINRVSMLQAVAPEKIFLLGGINGLTDANIDQAEKQYKKLVADIRSALPDATLYIQSVLPVSQSKEVTLKCHNTTIAAFNTRLEQLAQEQGATYVDLYTLYEKGGQLNPEFTPDGVHLLEDAYGLWKNAISQYIIAE